MVPQDHNVDLFWMNLIIPDKLICWICREDAGILTTCKCCTFGRLPGVPSPSFLSEEMVLYWYLHHCELREAWSLMVDPADCQLWMMCIWSADGMDCALSVALSLLDCSLSLWYNCVTTPCVWIYWLSWWYGLCVMCCTINLAWINSVWSCTLTSAVSVLLWCILGA
jgi:hypothetical protein